jgi:hypothetical protein
VHQVNKTITSESLLRQENSYQNSLEACFKLYRDVKTADLSIKNILHIFDHCIKLIILYRCENWCIIDVTPRKKNTSIFDTFKNWGVEKLNMKFCKFYYGGIQNLYKCRNLF